MKKRIGIAAVCLTAGCAMLLAGCAGGPTQNVVYLSSNWYANTGFKKFQPTFIENGGNFKGKEVISYEVKFDNSNATNSTYSVNYGDGTYVTEFYALNTNANAQFIHADYKSGYPESAFTVYCYKTALATGKATFKFGEETKEFPEGQSRITESYFLSVEDGLRPLYTHQEIKSVTPAVLQAGSLESTYSEQNYTYTTWYAYDGTQAVTEIKHDGETESTNKTEGLNNSPNTLFDVAYLDIVTRACKLSPSLSQQISLFAPNSGVSNYTLSGSSRALGDTEKANIAGKLEQAGLYVKEYVDGENGEKVEKGLDTVAVSVNYNATLTGVSQTYWFAGINNLRNNTGRATLLKIEYPQTFNLGVFTYTLSNIQSTLWDGKSN